MIYRLDETHYTYAFENSLNIVADSNQGDSFLIQADTCPVDFLESWDDDELETLLNEEPFIDIDDEDIEIEEIE